MNTKIDLFFSSTTKWKEAYCALRSLALDCGLTEEFKWGWPCYTYRNSNVVLIHGFKEYCALLFMKGALMHDPEGILIKQSENVQAARQIRFQNYQDIVENELTLKSYIIEALNVEKNGLKLEPKNTAEFNIPEEFKNRLEKMPELESSFKALTPGRQRAYLLFFSSAKQSKTREARIDKNIPRILSGKGIDD